MTDRKGVLVRFPADVLADLDAEAKRTGKARMEVIVERCRKPAPAPPAPATRPGKPAGSPPGGVSFGPRVYTPGERLKKR